MISFLSASAHVLERTRQMIRIIAFSDMNQIAKGWGLNATTPSPLLNKKPVIDLHFSTHSRRTLCKSTKRTLPGPHVITGRS